VGGPADDLATRNSAGGPGAHCSHGGVLCCARLRIVQGYIWPRPMLKGRLTALASVVVLVALTAGAAVSSSTSAAVSSSRSTVVTSVRPVSVPASWQKVSFGGLTMYAPGNWPTVTEQGWGDCGRAGQPLFRVWSVVLDTGVEGLTYGCPDLTSKSSIPAVFGLVVDPGPYGPLNGVVGFDVVGFDKCLHINGLSVCQTSFLGGILVVAVHIPGRTRRVAVEIGLAGNGIVAHTILYSMRAD
jgi:hypothetical protein